MKKSHPVCEYTIEGNPDGPTLVFVHGWPDNASLWRLQAEALGGEFRCVLVTLPNFGEQSVKAGGYDFPGLVTRLAATIDEVQPAGQVGLVTHDWGAYIGYLLEQQHPGKFRKMAALDIGGYFKPADIKASLMIIAYQWTLVAAWLCGGVIPPLGNVMAKSAGKILRVPARQQALIRSRFGYPYFYFWRNALLPWKRGNLLGRYRPQCPVLFMFGERKPMMFHSPRWLQIVADSGGGTIGIAGAGHWFMETHPEIVNGNLREWFSELSEG